ncbi:uncharacterized protein Z518_05557 [Rhinocladiella mackenziei CBS 650.93]|uniref:Uncharacterized protein n=1 Tax=Rhinocladiella mackenziei CBS 650.93 TaxID=1442369 RepID=A0A0D2FR57_9EURO|nr:uncharacterized protein Z518_05557 [Rhinocladiella mackenziei CBS 650.93]KIX04687.1 hypothetical protein Z518_05557 [Rhinocladiella mackenziei CBS 650.93]
MPPVPLHISSPINANTPSHPLARSPSTAAARYTPVNTDAGLTTTESSDPSQPARPGAPAGPLPTNTISSTYNNRFPPAATTTALPETTRTSDSPPPPSPLPGAVPSPFTNGTSRSGILQSPHPIEVPQWTPSSASPVWHTLPSPTPTHSRPTPLPPRQKSPSVYTPVRSTPPTGVTSTYPPNLSHPPGYMQDSRSSFDDMPVEFCHSSESRASLSSSRRGGILDGEPTFQRDTENESFLNTAVAWAKAAGERLSKTEEQIWKTINGDNHT